MQSRHTKINVSIINQSRKPYRDCAWSGVQRGQQQPSGKTVRAGKRIAIRWPQAKSWVVPIRVAPELEEAGL
jgi:hypothetical protein